MLDRRILSIADREREYSPSTRAHDFAGTLAAYADRSAAARADLNWTVLPYGSRPDEIVAVCEPEAGAAPAPVHVFIHGGYWQELTWRESLFAAPGLVRSGIAFAAINYTLAPEADIARIVVQCRAAVAALAKARGGRRVVVSGSSAGAHLAAMLAHTDWEAYGLATSPLGGLILLSGIYDLEPLVGTSINDALRLDAAEAARLSPLTFKPPAACPVVIAYGEHETDAFKGQSIAYADRLRAAGIEVACVEIAGRDHFDIVFDLADPQSVIGAAALRLSREDAQV